MTQGLYSFSEARHELKRKEHSKVRTGQNTSKTIGARYRGTEHGQDNKSEGYRGSQILGQERNNKKQNDNKRTIEDQGKLHTETSGSEHRISGFGVRTQW